MQLKEQQFALNAAVLSKLFAHIKYEHVRPGSLDYTTLAKGQGSPYLQTQLCTRHLTSYFLFTLLSYLLFILYLPSPVTFVMFGYVCTYVCNSGKLLFGGDYYVME